MNAHVLKNTSSEEPLSVLLIEDNMGYCYFVDDVLLKKHEGLFTLKQAHDLASGLALLRQDDFDVVLLDLGLPDSARFDTFAQTFKATSTTPIIILTVLDDDDVAVQALRSGAQDYLMKDKLDAELLVRAIKYAVERAYVDEKIRRLSGQLLQMQDDERRRVARALHDTTAQNLAALCMSLSMLEKQADGLTTAHREILRGCTALAETSSDEIRTTAYLLHPPLLEELGLSNALREYVDGFTKRSHIEIQLALPEDLPRMSARLETTVFRVMQESLSNIHRHSGSPSAEIVLSRSEQDVVLTIRDSGKGFRLTELPDERGIEGLGVGIAGMRERLRQLGGHLSIASSDQGTTVTAQLPVRGAEA